jgi:hypothetical protein
MPYTEPDLLFYMVQVGGRSEPTYQQSFQFMHLVGRAALLWKRLVYVTLHSVEMLCGQSLVTRAEVSLFVSRLFMARQMTMGVSGRPAA